MRRNEYYLRCRLCGKKEAAYQGWSFIKDRCEGAEQSMYHQWEAVPRTGDPFEPLPEEID